MSSMAATRAACLASSARPVFCAFASFLRALPSCLVAFLMAFFLALNSAAVPCGMSIAASSASTASATAALRSVIFWLWLSTLSLVFFHLAASFFSFFASFLDRSAKPG